LPSSQQWLAKAVTAFSSLLNLPELRPRLLPCLGELLPTNTPVSSLIFRKEHSLSKEKKTDHMVQKKTLKILLLIRTVCP
jgi:hypothetical protein